MTPSSILFICLGNICRSPLAEGVLRHEAEKRGMANQLTIDSAGTSNWHIGSAPDERTIENAAMHDVDISNQVCRQLVAADFFDFDLILAMDNANISNIRAANHENGSAQISLFTAWAGMGDQEIPDPYYGGQQGFEIAYKMIEQAAAGTLDRIAAP
ncbi:MAG: low molecular weight phosphotyrosine protein phosphatase [Rhizobiaceae bacterium]|nr:low molecular weight phosphotyrosine protein phosphatase [Rhizobiaceae bacterium]